MSKFAERLSITSKVILQGPERKKFKIGGRHRFNIKPGNLVRHPLHGMVVSLSGQISHCLRFRPDDQVYYTVKFTDGMPSLPPDIGIDRGGIANVVKTMISMIAIDEVSVFGIKISPKNLPSIATEISKIVEGRGWEGVVAAIITHAALVASLPSD